MPDPCCLGRRRSPQPPSLTAVVDPRPLAIKPAAVIAIATSAAAPTVTGARSAVVRGGWERPPSPMLAPPDQPPSPTAIAGVVAATRCDRTPPPPHPPSPRAPLPSSSTVAAHHRQGHSRTQGWQIPPSPSSRRQNHRIRHPRRPPSPPAVAKAVAAPEGGGSGPPEGAARCHGGRAAARCRTLAITRRHT